MPKQQNVLIVDDDESVRDVVRKVLEQYGYDVTSASSGQIALDMLDELHPDLILLDIMMPGLSGIDVLKRLRERHDTRPVIMLTASKDIKLLEQAFALDATDYLTKPFIPAVLAAHIRAKLRRVSGNNNEANQ